MNPLHRLKRSTPTIHITRTSHKADHRADHTAARKAGRVATLAPLVMLAGLLVPSTPATAATPLGAPVTDSAGNLIPPMLNAHVDPWCADIGTSGARVEMLLIEEDVNGAGAGELTPAARTQFIAELREEARYIDDAFAIAATDSGGANGKRIRWSHEPGVGCTPMVRTLVVPVGSTGHNAGAAMSAVQQAYPGLLTTNRLYLGFTAKATTQEFMPSCGQAMTQAPKLQNNGSTIQFARINHTNTANGTSCHSVDERYDSTTLHELMHIMGAAYAGAPGSDGGSHCTDGYDTLCEAQNDLNPKCEGRWVIDCGKDTYFNTNPAPGTYLADPANWNTANSPFLGTVPPLPTPPSASVTFDKTTAVGNDIVTATVQTIPGANVEWSTNGCDYTDAPTSVIADSNGRATYTIQCYDQAKPTVSARVWRTGEKMVSRPKATMTYTRGEQPSLTVTGPTSAAPGQQITLTANTTAPGDWTYEWFAAQEGCGLPVWDWGAVGTPGKSVTISCDGSLTNTEFYAEAVRAQDQFPASSAPHKVTITTTAPPTGALDVRLSGSLLAKGGNTFAVAAKVWTNNATAASWAWSASNGCTATPVATDPSVADVTCPTATSATVTITATATAADGRTGSGAHRVTVSPGSPPVPPPPVPPTTPVSPKATLTDLTATANGNNTTVTVTVKAKTGTPLAGQRIAVETRPRTGGAYTTLAWVTTGANGTASANISATTPVFVRAQFPGDATWTASVSREVSASAAIVVKAAKWASKGLTGTVKTTGGAPAASVVLAVEKKVGSKWKKVTSATTNTKGVAQVKINVTTKMVFRLVASASSTYRADTSPNLTLKP